MSTGPHDPEPGEQPSWPQYDAQQSAPHGAPYGVPYGAAYTPPQPLAPLHPQATTALVLGIVGLAGTFVCGITIFLGPFAWVLGARAKREIAAAPGRYRGAGEAGAGMILGIVTTVLLILAIVAVVLVIALVLAADGSSSTSYSNV